MSNNILNYYINFFEYCIGRSENLLFLVAIFNVNMSMSVCRHQYVIANMSASICRCQYMCLGLI